MAKWVRLTGAADGVLREMRRATAERRGLPFDLYVEGYKNGRERGHAVSYGDHVVAFAEYRNTDEIVVYAGKSIEFESAGNVPSDEAWRRKRFFPKGAYERAARYALRRLGVVL